MTILAIVAAYLLLSCAGAVVLGLMIRAAEIREIEQPEHDLRHLSEVA